jgi:hypothetical protein
MLASDITCLPCTLNKKLCLPMYGSIMTSVLSVEKCVEQALNVEWVIVVFIAYLAR